MTPDEQVRHKASITLFAYLAAAYGAVCTVLLFFLPEGAQSSGQFLVMSIFSIGGFCSLYSWLLLLLLTTQQGEERERTERRLKMVSLTGIMLVVTLFVALLVV